MKVFNSTLTKFPCPSVTKNMPMILVQSTHSMYEG